MQLTTVILSALVASTTACAIPTPKPSWTVKDVRRSCVDGKWHWAFDVDKNNGEDLKHCDLILKADYVKQSIIYGVFFGTGFPGPYETSFHIYEHVGHIEHIFPSFKNKDLETSQPLPDSNWEVLITEHI